MGALLWPATPRAIDEYLKKVLEGRGHLRSTYVTYLNIRVKDYAKDTCEIKQVLRGRILEHDDKLWLVQRAYTYRETNEDCSVYVVFKQVELSDV